MANTRRLVIKPLLISVLAGLAMIAVWFNLSARLDNPITWFGYIAALDIALLERWTRGDQVSVARWIAPSMTAFCSLGSLWLISALSVHYASGFSLLDSAQHMGLSLFKQLLVLRFSPWDWLNLALAPGLAYFLAQTKLLNGRRQSP